MMKSLHVVAAVIVHQDKILCALKGEHKFAYLSNTYEFPGGKVELNETPEQALVREIKEELQIDIQVTQYLLTVDHTYPDFRIQLATYLCEVDSIDGLALTEHKAIKWCVTEELKQLDWATADLPIVHYLLDNVVNP